MKKAAKTVFSFLLALVSSFAAFSFAGCGESGAGDDKTIVVGASSTPHAEILNLVKEDLAAEGYDLKVTVYSDYVFPNLNLESGDLDANYFQHTPYLETFNAEHGTHLVALDKIHYEPFGIYGKNVSAEDFANVKTGRTIYIPNDGSNGTRALFLLQEQGYITLRDGVKGTDTLTTLDIADAKGNTVVPQIAEILCTQLSSADDGSLAVINGNYALEGGLTSADVLAYESAEGEAASLYANVVAVRSGNEQLPKIQALLKALKSQKVFDFINSNYGGAVQPVFTVGG